MSPEQWNGAELDSRADIYAVGCILYELLTGTLAFDADTLQELEKLHLTGSIPQLPEDSDLNRRLNKVFRRCLAKDARQRYGSIAELSNALTKIYQSHFKANPRVPKFKYSTNEKDFSNLGTTRTRAGDHESALEAHDRAIALNPLEARFYVNRGITFDNLGRRKEAMNDFNRAVALNPRYARAYYHRALILYKIDRREEAKEEFIKTILLDPTHALAYTYLGHTLFDLGQTEDAFFFHEQALEIEPRLVPVYNNRGYELAQLNRPREAEANFLRARELDPFDALSSVQLGFLYDSQGEHLQAAERFEEAFNLGCVNAKSLAANARRKFFDTSSTPV